MKKGIGALLVAVMFISCEDGIVTGAKIDSAGAKLQTTVEKTADTVVSKIDQWTDSLRNDRNDTLNR